MDYDGNKNTLYDYLVDFIKTQLLALQEQGKNPSIHGLFWMQGESDAQSLDTSLLYKNHFVKFINYLQYDLKDYIYDEMIIVDPHISSRCQFWRNYQLINQAKNDVSNILYNHYVITINGEDGFLVLNKDETGEEPGDTGHFESLSMLNLGRKAGEMFLEKQ